MLPRATFYENPCERNIRTFVKHIPCSLFQLCLPFIVNQESLCNTFLKQRQKKRENNAHFGLHSCMYLNMFETETHYSKSHTSRKHIFQEFDLIYQIFCKCIPKFNKILVQTVQICKRKRPGPMHLKRWLKVQIHTECSI